MSRLKLTDVERVLLANQYEILAYIKNDPHYEKLACTLRDGHEWLYSQDLDHISENLAADKAEHVIKILGIYGDMHASFEKLSNQDGIDAGSLSFPGFDGNNEADLYSFARALQANGKFEKTLGPNPRNSHHPTTEMYERMIEKHRELNKPNFPYSREQIIAILDAQTHPSNKR